MLIFISTILDFRILDFREMMMMMMTTAATIFRHNVSVLQALPHLNLTTTHWRRYYYSPSNTISKVASWKNQDSNPGLHHSKIQATSTPSLSRLHLLSWSLTYLEVQPPHCSHYKTIIKNVDVYSKFWSPNFSLELWTWRQHVHVWEHRNDCMLQQSFFSLNVC